jgi:DNA-binding NarL/FixJ family response regulator
VSLAFARTAGRHALAVRILIVDDSPAVRRALRACIEEKRGWRVCAEADNGARAIELFRQLRPDAVVIDFSMPVMNGLEAAREISRIAPTVPLLMCTMFKSEQLVTAVRKLGVKQVLSKSEGLGTNLVTAIEGLIHK